MSMIVRHTENYGLGSIEVTTTDLVIPSVGLTAISLGTVWGFLSGSEDGWTHGAQDVVDLAFLFFPLSDSRSRLQTVVVGVVVGWW